nr:putative reverse transcriptase domain-containing protein [Tanacetum cinerariifolium]
VPLILGRPFLQTARALIDVHGEEMILRDGDERLTLIMRHDTSSYSNQPQKESINMINIYDDLSEEFLEALFSTNHQSDNPTFFSHPKLTSPKVKDDVFDLEGGNVLPEKFLDLDSTKDLQPPHNINPLSGSTTSSSLNHLLKEFADELALITFPPRHDDLLFDIESGHKEIEYLLNNYPINDMDSILEDSVDEDNLADLNDNLVDTMPEMFTDEHTLDYSSPPLYDEYGDLFKVESETKYVYDDPFDSKGEKIKESKPLIDELDLPSDFFPPFEYDSFLSEDFSRLMLCLQPTTRTSGISNLLAVGTSFTGSRTYTASGNSLLAIKDFLRRFHEWTIPGGSLSAHLLATPVRVIGKTRSITTSCDTLGMLNKLTISKIRSICSWASSFLLLKKVMEASVSFISSNLSDESVRSFISRVILIGSIYVKVPVALEVGAAVVASPVEVLELDTHSSSEADPSELTTSRISSTYGFTFSVFERFKRNRVASRSSSPTTSTPEIPTTPIPPVLSAVDIPISQLYRTYPGGPCRSLTARKSVSPLSSHHLALRYTSYHLDRFTSESSSYHSSSDHSSSGHSISSHSVCGHTPPVTTVPDSSAPSRFVYPPVTRTSWYSKAYRHWRSATLSTMYLPTTFESSARDSSFESSVRPSRKRCRSPAATVTSSIHNSRALVLSRADLLLPRKRFRDSISPEDNMDILARVDACVDMKVDVEDEVEGEVEFSDRGTIEVRVNVVARIDILDDMLMHDAVEHLEQVEELVQDIYRQVIEIHLERVEDTKMGQRELDVRCLIASEERVGFLDGVASLERSNTRLRVANALAAYEANRATKLAVESQSKNGDDDDDGNVGGNRNINSRGNEDGIGGGNGNKMEEAMGMKILIGMIELLCMSPRASVVNQKNPTCFECGRQRHYKNKYPKLKNQICGNKDENKTNKARGKAYVLGGGEANPDSNVITGTFLLNSHYASMLFDSGTDMSFVSSIFSTLLDVIPFTLDVSYTVELANKRVVETNTVLRGYTLGLLGHPFNIDLMPVELGSFDVIIDMDWLANHHAVIFVMRRLCEFLMGMKF